MADTRPPAEPAGSPGVPGLSVAGVHAGRPACQALLREVLTALSPSAGAPVSAARQVWLVDPDFTDWPLDDPAVLSAWAAWLRPGGRQLCLVGTDFRATARTLPRLARWRRDWGHAMAVWSPEDGVLPPPMWGLLASPLWLQRQDAPEWRIRGFTDVVHARAVQAQFADFLQRCAPAWPVTTLGL